MLKMRQIEMYINYTDHTWGTEMVEIPADTPEKDIEQTATNMMMINICKNSSLVDVAFVGVYHIPEIGE